jgi:hypothetical protein
MIDLGIVSEPPSQGLGRYLMVYGHWPAKDGIGRLSKGTRGRRRNA